MDKIQNNILDISHNYYKYLMSLENVNGVGLGFKNINGICTKEPCIHVLVKNKIHNKFLTSNNIIPKKYMGIKTDVISVGTPKFSFGYGAHYKTRPLQGGCAIEALTPELLGYGTLACIVTKKKIFEEQHYYILSNNHVLADFNNLPIGNPILQPHRNIVSENVNENIIARLETFIPLEFYTNPNKVNFVDCAIAKILNKSLISNKILEIGQLKGVTYPKLGMKVKKFGAKTGITEGEITSVGVFTILDYSENKEIAFKDQTICNLPSFQGDSGSLIINENNEAVGLYFSYSQSDDGSLEYYSYMNNINFVLKKLKVKLY